MSHTLSILPAAEADLDQARIWYERQRTGLGDDFLLCAEESLARLCRNPELYPVVHKQVRRAAIRRFPYGIFYHAIDQRVIVFAVMHARRSSRQWKSRL